MTQQKSNIKTIEVTNFTGRLTRTINGKLDSGYAKFANSFGYDPFSKPGNLTWLETPVDTDPSASSVSGVIVMGKMRVEGGIPYLYALDHAGVLYKITTSPTLGSAAITTSVIGNVSVLSGYTYGGGMEFYGTTEAIYVGGDNGVAKVNFDGSSPTNVGTVSTSSIVQNTARPLLQFAGALQFGNGNNIGIIDASGTVTSYSKLNPSFPPEINVRDLEISSDLNYLLIAAGIVPAENITGANGDRDSSAAGTGYVFNWNGSDLGATGGTALSSFPVTGLHSFLDKQISFTNDSQGAAIIEGTNKTNTLSNVKSPLPNAISANGNMITFGTVEKINSSLQGSLFYYGQLDTEVPKGLWRVFSIPATQSGGFMHNIPWQVIPNSMYSTQNNSNSSIQAAGYGKHLFSTIELAKDTGNKKYKLYYFAITPTGTGTPQSGIYETQTEIFSEKVSIIQVRIYTEPTVSGNGFQLDLIGSNGLPISGGTFTYTFAAGTDPTLVQGSLDRLNFNPAMSDTYSLALRFTNTGSVNMTIHKVEVELERSGK